MYNPFHCNPGQLVAWRNPTKADLKFGHGAIHYKTFQREVFVQFVVAGTHKYKTIEEAKAKCETIYQTTGVIVSLEEKCKRWTVCPNDGLRYYLPR